MELREKKESIRLRIDELLDLIERANRRIEAHQEAQASKLILLQWKEMKEEYTQELLELLRNQYDLKFLLVA